LEHVDEGTCKSWNMWMREHVNLGTERGRSFYVLSFFKLL